MMHYVYPAIFTKEKDGGYSIELPDFEGAYTCGDNLAQAMFMAKDCLGINLYTLEEDGVEFPKPNDMSKYKNTADCFVTLIDIDFDAYKRRVDEKPVRKTLYIPKKLNDKAEAMAINFSEVMRQALAKKLKVASD
ncbi:MAG: type II toxin-antitoxin system HicB family antitoxin [Christensenellaceae bacterium]|jgi:predicted RNase H-like HicB family nuclease|nr:type II toxin-antitoxin system HicB family antitoxin [Christensenellaceae bacterium]